MRIHIGGDHASFDLQRHLVNYLSEAGHDVVDHGPLEYDAEDDYPVFVLRAAEAVVREAAQGALGVVLGGSGNGEVLAANKVVGARAILAWSPDTARLGREHNNANIVSIGARQHTLGEATALVEEFIAAEFSGEERHMRRLAQVAQYEQTRELPPLGPLA